MEKETLCWGCANYSKCSWSKGIPVENWEATPTKITNRDGGIPHTIDSFFVHSCPQYIADARQTTSVKQIATIVGKHERTIARLLVNKERTRHLCELLKEKGYILYICKEYYGNSGRFRRAYYLERVGNESS